MIEISSSRIVRGIPPCCFVRGAKRVWTYSLDADQVGRHGVSYLGGNGWVQTSAAFPVGHSSAGFEVCRQVVYSVLPDREALGAESAATVDVNRHGFPILHERCHFTVVHQS